MTGTTTEAMVKIQVISDLHLEASPVEKATDIVNVSSGADVLIIAGDLGSFYDLEPMYKFLEWLSPWYKYILYVIGNHEYYRHPSFLVARLGDLRHPRGKDVQDHRKPSHPRPKVCFGLMVSCLRARLYGRTSNASPTSGLNL